MTDVKSWEDGAAAGLTLSETAKILGRSTSAGSLYAKRHGFAFPKNYALNRERNRERMVKLHADPEFAERHRERMRKLHADPEFAERHRERSRERMRKLHADPEFAERHRERHRERMEKLNADPEFAERHRERMEKLNADPEFNPLAALSEAQRAEYDILVKKGGFKRDEALSAIGRADLIKSQTGRVSLFQFVGS